MSDYLRVAFAANLNRSADMLEGLAKHCSAANQTQQEANEEMQAQLDAGAAIWGAVLRGFLTVPEVVAEAQELTDSGYTEVDSATDNGALCANLFFAVMREFVYPLGESVAPYSLASPDDGLISDEMRLALRREELRSESTGCRTLASLVSTSAISESPAPTPLPAATANSERDKWLYNQCCKIVAYSKIIHDLAKKPKWEQIESIQGVKQAANRYAAANNLPAIPSRHPGRIAKRK